MDTKRIKLGIAPIGWTNDDLPELGGSIPFEQCVSEMALAGYEGCEIGGKFPRDPDELKKALALRKLQVCNAWFSAWLTNRPLKENVERFREHCAFLQTMGARVVGISEQGGSIQGQVTSPIFRDKPVFTAEEWDRLIRGIREFAGHAAGFGIRLTFHHHMGTGVQTVDETRRLLDETASLELLLLYDTGHFAFSGEDPLAALKEFMPRVGHIHLKDIRADVLAQVKTENLSFLDAVRRGVFTVPGDGSIDFAPIFKVIADSDYRGWMVVEAEQDPARANPLEYAMKGYAYIRQSTAKLVNFF